MRIDDDIALALSGGTGFDLTAPTDCNVFMLRGETRWVVFDAGGGQQPQNFAHSLARDGIDPERVTDLILTHAHADHAGGAAGLRQTYGLTVHAGAMTAQLVESGDEDAIGLTGARNTGVYPPDYRFSACKIDRVLGEGDIVEVDGLGIELIATPGHSADHVSYLVTMPRRTVLIAGDALFFGGKVAIQDIPDCNIGDVCATVRKLAARDYDALLAGHLNFSLANGRRHAHLAMAYVRQSSCPPSII